MPITISAGGLYLTTDNNTPDNGQTLPGRAKTAIKNPCAVAIPSSGRGSNGQVEVVPAEGAAGRAGYYGYSYLGNRAAGQGCSILRGVIISGFSGVTPGAEVYIADDYDDDDPTATNLTHTPPQIELLDMTVSAEPTQEEVQSIADKVDEIVAAINAPVKRIGVGVGTDSIRFD